MTPTYSTAFVPASPFDATRSQNLADEVLARLCAKGMDLTSLWRMLSDIREDMRQAERLLEQHRPCVLPDGSPQPASPADAPGRTAARQKLAELSLRLVAVEEQIQEAFGTLSQLQEQDLPAAQAKDAQKNLEAAESQRRNLEDELEALRADVKKVTQREAHAGAWSLSEQTKATRLRALHMVDNATSLSAGSSAGDTPLPAHGETEFEPAHADALRLRALGRSANDVAQEALPKRRLSPSAPQLAALTSRWEDFISEKVAKGQVDPSAYLQYVMREAYAAGNEDLRMFGQRLAFYNRVRQQLRDELRRVRSHISEHVGEPGADNLAAAYTTKTFFSTPNIDASGVPQLREPAAAAPTSSTKALESYIKNLEENLHTVGEDTQICQIELQTISQRQQQTMQLLSNLSKQLHETSMSIIRKLGN